jgi:hypothetical protein
MRQAQQLLGQAELVEQPQGGGVQGVAAEVAEEVAVLLQHQHLHPSPGQQQPQHGPGRPAPGDHTGDPGRRLPAGRPLRHRHGDKPLSRSPTPCRRS